MNEVITAERAHAVLSASSAHRWLNCTPSARLEECIPDSTSEYAELGTLAHTICETELKCWLGQLATEEYNIKVAELRGDKRITPDMIEYCKRYVEICKEKINDAREVTPDAVVMVEERLDFSHLVPEGFGTGDLVIVADGVLEVTDLKTGTGVEVSAVDNEQLKLYGLGAVEKYGLLYDFDWVRLTIVQPRLREEPSSWDVSVADLVKWGADVVAPTAQKAWAGDGDYKASDWCRFCRARGNCRARADENLALTAHEFAEPALLSDEEIASILGKADQLKKWANDVQTYALSRASAGHKLPDWKLVRGRSNRAFTDPDVVAKTLIDAGFPEATLYERSLLGLTALEKVVTKKRFNELLEGLVTKPPGKPTLVPSSDTRAEVESSALDGFEDVGGGEDD